MPQSSSISQISDLSEVITQDEIDRRAWKYTGYRGFANFVASDPDFLVLRRFDALNARVLLTLQDNLSALEYRLEELDKGYCAKSVGDVNNGSVRDDKTDRATLILEIHNAIKDYNTILLAHSELRSRPPPPKRNITNIKNWFYNNDGAIVADEQRFILHEEDLILVVKSEKATMRQFMESQIVFRLHWLWKKDPPPDTRDVDKEVRIYYKDEKIDLFTTIALLLSGMTMLIAPIWILAIVINAYVKLGIITAFIVVFLVIVSFATVAKPSEALGATAAYSAVLMVFLQLGSSGDSSR